MAVCAAAAHCHALDALLEQYATAVAPYDVGELAAQPSFEAVAAFAHTAASPLLAYFANADVLTPELLVEALAETHADGSTHTYTHVPAFAAALWTRDNEARHVRVRNWWGANHVDVRDPVYFRLLVCGVGGLVLVRAIFELLDEFKRRVSLDTTMSHPLRTALMHGLQASTCSCVAHALVPRDVIARMHADAKPDAWYEIEGADGNGDPTSVYGMWGCVVLVYALDDTEAALTRHLTKLARARVLAPRADVYFLFEAAIVGSNVELLEALARVIDARPSILPAGEHDEDERPIDFSLATAPEDSPIDFLRSTPRAVPSCEFVRRGLAASHTVVHYLYAHDTFARGLLAPELAPERARACCWEANDTFVRAVLQSNDCATLARYAADEVVPHFTSSTDFNLAERGPPSVAFVEAVLDTCGLVITPEQEDSSMSLEYMPLASVPPLAFMSRYRAHTPQMYVMAALRDSSPESIVEALAPIASILVTGILNDTIHPPELTPTSLIALSAYKLELEPRHYPTIATTPTLHAAFATYLRTASLFVTVHHMQMTGSTHTSALTPLIRAAFAERDQAALARELLAVIMEHGSVYLFRAAAYIEPACPGTPWVSSGLIELVLEHVEDGGTARREYVSEIIRSRLIRPMAPVLDDDDDDDAGGTHKRARTAPSPSM